MDEKSTQVKSDRISKKSFMPTAGASSKTLSFLKIVARTYYVEPSLPVGLNSTCVN